MPYYAREIGPSSVLRVYITQQSNQFATKVESIVEGLNVAIFFALYVFPLTQSVSKPVAVLIGLSIALCSLIDLARAS